MKRAIALRIKMVPSDIDISLSLAFTTGATAAIALPPHIAVPAEMRYDVLRSIISLFPRYIPRKSTLKTETIVNSIPSRPVCNDSWRFMPKPNPTTENCNRYLDVFFAKRGKGCPASSAKASPANRATAGDTTGSRHAASSTTKITRLFSLKTCSTFCIIFLFFCFSFILCFRAQRYALSRRVFYEKIGWGITSGYRGGLHGGKVCRDELYLSSSIKGIVRCR